MKNCTFLNDFKELKIAQCQLVTDCKRLEEEMCGERRMYVESNNKLCQFVVLFFY